MLFLESGQFCNFSEYEQGKSSRVYESDITVGDTYMYMMQLQHCEEAAMQPTLVQSIGKRFGKTIVDFAFLDEDLKPYAGATEKMNLGFILDIEGIFVADETNYAFEVVNAYLKKPKNELLPEEFTVSAGLRLQAVC
jgi:hypothetical protein